FVFVGVFGVSVFFICVFLFAFLLLVFRRFKGNRTQWLPEIACADGPGNCLTVIGPAKIVRPNIGNLFERDGWSTDADRRSFTAIRGYPDQIGIARLAAIECAVLAVISIATEKNDFRSIGRKSRIAINSQ